MTCHALVMEHVNQPVWIVNIERCESQDGLEHVYFRASSYFGSRGPVPSLEESRSKVTLPLQIAPDSKILLPPPFTVFLRWTLVLLTRSELP